jgi:hypothetical protein
LTRATNKSWLAKTALALWELEEHDASVRTMEKIRPYALRPEHLESTIRFLKESINNKNFDTGASPTYDTFVQRW